MRIARHRPFGFSPKISTPVEKTVEKLGGTAVSLKKTGFLARFHAATAVTARGFGLRQRLAAPFLRP
jgi:hypothetical protein